MGCARSPASPSGRPSPSAGQDCRRPSGRRALPAAASAGDPPATTSQNAASSWLRRPLRSSGPSKTGGVACQARSRSRPPSDRISGTSQWPVVASRCTPGRVSCEGRAIARPADRPEKAEKSRTPGFVDRQPRQDSMPPCPENSPQPCASPARRSARRHPGPARWPAGVRPQGEAIADRAPNAAQPVGQQALQRHAAPVIIDRGQQHHIGIKRRQHPQHRLDLRVLPPKDVAHQKPRPLAVKPDIPGGDLQRFCGKRRRAARRPAAPARSAAVATGLGLPCPTRRPQPRRFERIMAAIRAMATPRITRLAGRKAHAATVQISVCGEPRVSGAKLAETRTIAAGIRNGSRTPKERLMRASRSSRPTTSPPAVGSKVGRLTQTLKA
jgi:hypothetical protein